MENTENLDINIEDIGTILKSSRLKQKKSMEDISSELCIRKIYLTALEEGDYETLPPIPYGVGYVRCYARYLGLNPERAVKLYKAAAASGEEMEEDKKETPEVNKSSSKHIVAGILALVVVYGGWSWYASSISPEIEEDILQQEEILPEDEQAQEVMEQVIISDDVTDQTSETKADEENQIVETQGVAPQGLVDEESAINESVSEVLDNKVIVEFTGESWVELKDKNKIYIQGVFHQGDKKEMDYTDNLFLSVGRPENVKIYIKGAPKDIMARRRKTNIPLDSLN